MVINVFLNVFQINPVTVAWSKVIRLGKISNLPVVGDFISRYVKVGVVLNVKPITNFVCVPYVSNDDKTWIPKPYVMPENAEPGEMNDFVIRYNGPREATLLIEAGMTTKSGDVSLGHVVLPLYDEKGNATSNKIYELPMQPDTFNLTSTGHFATQSTTKWETLLHELKKTPTISVKLSQANKAKFTEYLPELGIWPSVYHQFYAFFRQALARLLNKTGQIAARFSAPIFFAAFLRGVDNPLIMEPVRTSWSHSSSDLGKLSEAFVDFYDSMFSGILFLDTKVYEISSLADFSINAKRVLELANQCRSDPITFLTDDKQIFRSFDPVALSLPVNFKPII
ncbi:hypothetical protein Ciccas_000847 [Cichlidogyrus casuarinus]|uniref:Uncharacterized protein n=1 Tax=Cichlidogyrus casuarinus TaxID=1844966 RepID=A0ABD2QLR8_9PLAT